MIKIITTVIFSLFVTFQSFGYNASNQCIDHIKKYESCSLTAYWDSNGYSIGYGHHGGDVKKGMKISISKANKFLRSDLRDAEIGARRIIDSLPYKYKFSQNFFDGLVDLVYNCGEYGVKSSTFYSRLKKCRVKNGKINQNDFDFTLSAVKTMKISAKGHIKRRKATYLMMIK